eukprot:364380-Chlamydomonas_euryale.AAC.12
MAAPTIDSTVSLKLAHPFSSNSAKLMPVPVSCAALLGTPTALLAAHTPAGSCGPAPHITHSSLASSPDASSPLASSSSGTCRERRSVRVPLRTDLRMPMRHMKPPPSTTECACGGGGGADADADAAAGPPQPCLRVGPGTAAPATVLLSSLTSASARSCALLTDDSGGEEPVEKCDGEPDSNVTGLGW